MSENRIVFGGVLASSSPLRYSPAGVAILECVIEHDSTQVEAGFERQVKCRIDAVAAAEVAQALAQVDCGATLRVAGFLSAKNRHGSQLVLHVTRFEIG